MGGTASQKTVPVFEDMIRKDHALSTRLVTDAKLKAE